MSITRSAVIGYVVVLSFVPAEPGEPVQYRRRIRVIPLSIDWMGESEGLDILELDLQEPEKVLGLIPAVTRTFRARWIADRDPKDWGYLGFELPGAFHPDWNERTKGWEK